jgi:hypothetical protein
MSRTNEEAEAKWPEVCQAINPEPLLEHMGKFIETTPRPSRDEVRAEIESYLQEKLRECPIDEVISALAHTLGAATVKIIREIGEKRGWGV